MCGDIILKINSKSFRQKIITPPPQDLHCRICVFQLCDGRQPGAEGVGSGNDRAFVNPEGLKCGLVVFAQDGDFVFFKRIKLCGSSKKKSLLGIYGNSASK